ncbi:MAG: hypothetical protein AB1634_07785, partial [Thermodesulfobacteriota bacterium]
YSGILLLDPELRVVAAASRGSAEGDQGVLGTSYSGVTFHQASGSSHRVLTPYRVDRRHPTGSRGLEIALPLGGGSAPQGWLLFQLDQGGLLERFNLDEAGLLGLRFPNPGS